MIIHQKFAIAAVVAATSLLSACGSTTTTTSVPVSSQISNSYGVVDSIQIVQVTTEKKGPGAGAIVGGIVGGILGNQVGGGAGNTVATVAGAVGGAVVGNKVEQNNSAPQSREMYQITVRMDNGSYQTLTQENIADVRVGTRVHVENNQAYRL
ncbi:glycine zipper 2TM domain-containing protein [Undibacterium sp. TJN25]|uniref:glycine zipper 2TM domain-containing protein n=1 Tax=Undibacterium sp. TJN25 TaxID=3413056 RepID=UPI003BF1FFBF